MTVVDFDRHFDNQCGSYPHSEDDFHTGCWNVSHNQQQVFSWLHPPGRSINYKHWLTWITTNNRASRSRDYTNPDDQPTTNIDSLESQPTTGLLMTTPTRKINQLQTLTHLDHNQQQVFSWLHQPGRSTNYNHWLTWVTTNNRSSHDYTHPDDQPTINIDSPGSQPTAGVLMTTPTRTINQLQTSVTTNNRSSHDYTHPDDQTTTIIDSPGSQPATGLLMTTPTWTINQLQSLTHLSHNQQQVFSWLHRPGWSTDQWHFDSLAS